MPFEGFMKEESGPDSIEGARVLIKSIENRLKDEFSIFPLEGLQKELETIKPEEIFINLSEPDCVEMQEKIKDLKARAEEKLAQARSLKNLPG